MIAVVLGIVTYWQADVISAFTTIPITWIIYTSLALVGGAVYAPVAMIGIQGLALVPKNAAGTVAGFLSLFGYLFGDAILSKIILGRILNQGHFAWNTAFWIFVIGSIISIIVCGIAWNKEKRMMEERIAAAVK